jgi:hypothetical protein
MSHYTVGYLDESRQHKEICAYAQDSWDARNVAVNDVPYLQRHPSSIDCILVEGGTFSAVR